MSTASFKTTKGQQLLFFPMATPLRGRDTRIADSVPNMWAAYKDTANIVALMMVLVICGPPLTAYIMPYSGGVKMFNAFVLDLMPMPAFIHSVIRIIADRSCGYYQ